MARAARLASGILIFVLVLSGCATRNARPDSRSDDAGSAETRAHLIEAARLVEDGAYAEAIAAAARALLKDADNARAHAIRADVYLRMGNIEKALYNAERATSLDPEDGYASEVLARVISASESRPTSGTQELRDESTRAAVASTSTAEQVGSGANRVVPVLAVLDFEVQNLSESDARIISDLVSSALIKTRRYRVIDRRQRESLLSEIEFSNSDCTDEQCQLELGRLLAADHILVGNLGKVGSRHVINIKLLEVSTGEALSTAYEVYGTLDELVDNCEALALQLGE